MLRSVTVTIDTLIEGLFHLDMDGRWIIVAAVWVIIITKAQSNRIRCQCCWYL